MYPFLLSASLIANFADSLFGPLYAVYVQGIGGDILDVGNTIALYSIATGVLIIVFGKLSDHGNKSLFATIGLLLSTVGTLGYLAVKTPFHLYLLQILFAVSTAFLYAPFSALFAEHVEKKNSGLQWALEGGGGKILSGLGLLLGTYLAYRFGFVTVFLIIATFQTGATLLLFRVYLKTKRT